MNKATKDRYDAWAVELAMETLERKIEPVVSAAPLLAQTRFNNALLNLAVNRIASVEGRKMTATILWRLADAIASGTRPSPSAPVDLTSLDS